MNTVISIVKKIVCSLRNHPGKQFVYEVILDAENKSLITYKCHRCSRYIDRLESVETFEKLVRK